MDDLQTWRARIGLYCARMHRTHRGPNKSCGLDTYSTHVHGRKSLSDGASGGALLAMSLLSIAIAMFSLLTVAGDIELNPGPEKDTNPLEVQLSSVSHLRELKNKLWDVRVEWFRLGVELGIAVPDLDAIKVKRREDPDNCFTDMLSVWLKNSDAPTWTAILSALRTTGTNRRLADRIETELKEGSDTTQTDNDEISSSQPGPGVHFISSLKEIAHLPICNWYEVGTALKLDQYDLQSIQQKSTGDMDVCKIQMLKKWFNLSTQVTYEDLVKVLFSTGYENMEVAKEVCKNQGISASTIKVPQPLCVKQYVESLKAEYLRMPILKKDPWPPPPCEKYCDLIWANFTNEGMKFGDNIAKIFKVNTGKLQFLVNGMPGVGKTTFCKQIAKEWANGEILQNYDMVLLVQLRDPQNSGAKAYGDFFYHDEERIKEEVVKHIGRRSGNGVLFIFDGFDELSKRDRNKGSLFLDIFNGKKLKESSVVITSRPYASHNLEYSQYIELIGFDDDLIKSCIQKSIEDKAEAEQLQIRIIENDDLKHMCTVPNNLAIVIYIYKQEKGVLPNTLTGLYSNFISNTLHRNAQHLKPKKRAKYVRSLEELAFKGLSEDKLTFTVDEMSVEEGSTLGLMTASESYNSSGQKIAYNFLHLTIQEYLAACWIANLPGGEQAQFVRKNYDNSRFYVTLIFLAGSSTKLINPEFNEALQFIFEKALNDVYIDVTSKNRLNDRDNNSWPFYNSQNLETLYLLVSLLHERGDLSAIDSKNMLSESLDRVLLVDLQHIPSNYKQNLLGTFISKSEIMWERIEVIFDSTKGYEQLVEFAKDSYGQVRQLGLHGFSLLNCSDLLECPMFDKLEYLRVDSILYFREVCINDQTLRWGADNNPKDCDKLKNLLKNGQLKHLLLHHITPLEADYIIKQSVTPYLAKCISLQTLCLHFERKIPSELLLDLFRAIQSNRSIVTLNLSIGFDTLAIETPVNLPQAILVNIPAPIKIKVKERQKIVKALRKMIEKNNCVQNLSITRTESIRDNVFHWVDDTSNFMSALAFKSTVTKLTISCNLLYVPLLGDILKQNKTLTSLTLNEVDSMYKGAQKSSRGIFIFLAQGLKQNTTLKRLCLNSSKFHFSGQSCPKCEHFVLDLQVFMNGIREAEIDSNNHFFHLLKAIRTHSSLEELVFDYYSDLQQSKLSQLPKEVEQFCLFSDKNQKALFDLLLHNKCLKSLTISGYNFTEEQLGQAARALVLNGRRKHLNMMLTENLSKDDTKIDDLVIQDDGSEIPHSDAIRALAMLDRTKASIDHDPQLLKDQDIYDDNSSTNSDFTKVDKNADIIQDEVNEFKKVMFRAMVTVFSHILCIRHAHQKCFLMHICASQLGH